MLRTKRSLSPSFVLLALFLLLVSSLSCSSVKVEDFRGTQPTFVLEDYFLGNTKAWGLVHDRSGKLTRQFTVDLFGEWEDEELKLTEDFLYSDGEKERRIWRIKRLDEHTYEGRADDVVGVAIGKQFGQALHWSYNLRLPVDGSVWTIHFEDWMYLQPNNVLFNRAEMSKWGIKVGEVSIFFLKQ